MPASWIQQVWYEAINSVDPNIYNVYREIAQDLDASSEGDNDTPSDSSESSSSGPRFSPESQPGPDAAGTDDLPDDEGANSADLGPSSMEDIHRIAGHLATEVESDEGESDEDESDEDESDEDGLSAFDADPEIDLRSLDSDWSEVGSETEEYTSSEVAQTVSEAGSGANEDNGVAGERVPEESSPSQSSSNEEDDDENSEDDPNYDPNSITEAEAAADRRYGWEPLRRMLEYVKTARHVELPNLNGGLSTIIIDACSRTSEIYQIELGLDPGSRWRLGPAKITWWRMQIRTHLVFRNAFGSLLKIHDVNQWSANAGKFKAEKLISYSQIMQNMLGDLAMYKGEMEIRRKLRHARYLGKVMEQIEQVRDTLVSTADEINKFPRTTEFFSDKPSSRIHYFCTLCAGRGKSLSPIPGTWGAVQQVQELVVAVYDLCRPLVNDPNPRKRSAFDPYGVARDITNANALFEACHPFVFRVQPDLWQCPHPYFRELGRFRLHQLRALAMEVWAESINTQLKAGGFIENATGQKARVGRLAENVYNGWELGAVVLGELRNKKLRKLRRKHGIDPDKIARAIWFDPSELTSSEIAKIRSISSQP